MSQQQSSTGRGHESGDAASATSSSPLLIAASWTLVGVPLAYGLWQTLIKASQLLG